MHGIFTNIYPINDPNVGKYTIHGSYGYTGWWFGAFLMTFHSVGNVIIPTDEIHVFFHRGWSTTNQIIMGEWDNDGMILA